MGALSAAGNVQVVNDGNEQWAAMHAGDNGFDESAATAVPATEGKSDADLVVDNSTKN